MQTRGERWWIEKREGPKCETMPTPRNAISNRCLSEMIAIKEVIYSTFFRRRERTSDTDNLYI